jgi:hypothetical protein
MRFIISLSIVLISVLIAFNATKFTKIRRIKAIFHCGRFSRAGTSRKLQVVVACPRAFSCGVSASIQLWRVREHSVVACPRAFSYGVSASIQADKKCTGEATIQRKLSNVRSARAGKANRGGAKTIFFGGGVQDNFLPTKGRG